MKKTFKEISTSCFSGITVLTTYEEIVRQIGEPQHIGSGDNKVQYKWDCETEDGTLFTIYDWKEYEHDVKDAGNIWWHIGAVPGNFTKKVYNELTEHFATVKGVCV